MTKSYEYTDDAGRVLCWAHDMINCGDCRYINELESRLKFMRNQLRFYVEGEKFLVKQNKRYREALEFYAENSPIGGVACDALEGDEE